MNTKTRGTAGFGRRDFLRMAGLGLAGMGVGALASQARISGAAGRRPPNIIFIMADDLAWGDLGCYGQQRIRTPHIDRMAAEGMRFTNAYSGSPACAPSRCVLLTGLHTGHCRIRSNFPYVGGVTEYYNPPARRLSLTDADRTIGEELRDAGYATAAYGKWGIGEPGTAGTPNRRGFDDWLGYVNQNHASYYYTDYLWRNESREVIEANLDGRREVYTHDLFTEEALGFVHRNAERPFFLYLPYTIPHRRHEVPDLGEYADKPWHEQAKTYAAMITRMDRDVGRLMEELERLGLSDDTLIFFTSDNGEIRRLPWDDELFRSSAHFRGKKLDLYEGGIRVPMVARWPGVVPFGRVSDVPWYFPDVYTTLSKLCTGSVPSGLDGLDMLPILRGGAGGPDRALYWEVPRRDGLEQAVRYGRWKGVRFSMRQSLELYDLYEDESESRDVSSGNPGVVNEIESVMARSHVPSPHWPAV